MNHPNLTPQQAKIFNYIVDYQKISGFPPTVREIADTFGFKSPNAVTDHLKALEKKGYIQRNKSQARALEILVREHPEPGDSSTMLSIPILGRIAAGTPLLAVENLTGNIQIDSTIINAHESFALRVRGESMVEAGILEDDYVIIKRQAVADQGDIVAVMIDDEVTLKKYYLKPDYLELVPANSTMDKMVIPKGEKQVRIVGKMVGLIRKT